MTQEQIYTYFDNMLENPKSRNFLNHLVKSYMPISNITKVIDKPEGEFKCVITRVELISTQEILEGIHTEEFKADVMKSLKTMFDDNADKIAPMTNLIGEKKMGVTGKNTTTFLSVSVANELINWVMTKVLKGDKHINWLIGGIKHSSFVKRASSSNDNDLKIRAEKIAEKNDRTAKYQLGDGNDALSALKAKLEKSEK